MYPVGSVARHRFPIVEATGMIITILRGKAPFEALEVKVNAIFVGRDW